MSTFMWPSLVRGSSVVRGFEGQNISSQKPRSREVLLYTNIILMYRVGQKNDTETHFGPQCF